MNFSKIFHSLEILASSWLKKERIGDAIVFIECIRKNKWKIPQRSDHSWKSRDFVDKIRKNHEYEGKREFSFFFFENFILKGFQRGFRCREEAQPCYVLPNSDLWRNRHKDSQICMLSIQLSVFDGPMHFLIGICLILSCIDSSEPVTWRPYVDKIWFRFFWWIILFCND